MVHDGIKVLAFPPGMRNELMHKYLRSAQLMQHKLDEYELLVKEGKPREGVLADIRYHNMRHEVLLDLIRELGQYNDRLRVEMAELNRWREFQRQGSIIAQA